MDYLVNIDVNNYNLVGDTYLFNKENNGNSIIENMFNVYKNIEPEKDSKLAKAIYLKD